MRRILAALLLCTLGMAACADDQKRSYVIDAAPVPFATGPEASDTIGKLRHLGTLRLKSPDSDFGGLSSLIVSPDGSRFLAISDVSHWMTGELHYKGKRLSGASGVEIAPLRDLDGNPLSGKAGDAEGMAGTLGAVDYIEQFGEGAEAMIHTAVRAYELSATGNAVVVENCFPGSTGWEVSNSGTVAAGGIEGYATATSINKGESVDVKVNSGNGSTKTPRQPASSSGQVCDLNFGSLAPTSTKHPSRSRPKNCQTNSTSGADADADVDAGAGLDGWFIVPGTAPGRARSGCDRTGWFPPAKLSWRPGCRAGPEGE